MRSEASPKTGSHCVLALTAALILCAVLFTFPAASFAGVTLGNYARAAATNACAQYYHDAEDRQPCEAYLHYRIDQVLNPASAQGKCRTEFCDGLDYSANIKRLCRETCDEMKANE